jgi:hypothetical protein
VRRYIGRYLDRFYAPEDERKKTSRLKRWLYRLSTPTLILAFFLALELSFDPDANESRNNNLTWENSWWLPAVGAIILGITFPLIVSMFIVSVMLLLLPVALFSIAVTELIRKFILITLDKATNTRTSPFSYFAALLSVIVATIGLIHHFMA